MLAWYRRLIALRRELPALTDPHLATEAICDGGLLTIDRGPVRVVANLGDQDRKVAVPADARVVASSVPLDASAGADLLLPVDTVIVLHAPAR